MSILKRNKEVWHRRSPLTVVEFIIAFFTLVGGIYVLSPVLVIPYNLSHAPLLVQAAGSHFGLLFLGFAAVVIGAGSLWGIFIRNYRVRAGFMLSNIFLRIYVLVATWMIQGFLPLSWLTPLAIDLIAVVVWINLRGVVRVLFGK